MRASTILTLVLGAFALLVPTAQAATPKSLAKCDSARVDKAAGVARSLTNCGRANLGRGSERAARQALGRVSGALGVQKTTSDLGLLRATSTAAGPRVRFQQFVKGVPVRNGQVVVALGKSGKVQRVASGAVADTTLDATPSISRARALLTARRRVPSGFDTVSAPDVKLVAEPSARGQLQLAWQVILTARKPRGDWNVIVSARTGDVLKAWNAITRVNSALTYSPNPVQMTGNTALRDENDGNVAALATARQAFTLTDLDPSTQLIRGTFANPASGAVTGCALPYTPGQASSATRDYNFTRDDNRFEEAQAYLAVTGVQKTYASLGFPGIFPGPVPIDVHCIPDDNSFFSTSDNALHMGDGGVDDAEDSDVTVHEFGHATQAAQVPGFGPGLDTEQRAMGEGFGDFLATYYYLQTGNAAYQAARRFCVMEWDATSYAPLDAGNPGSGCLRWVDGTSEVDGEDIGQYPGTPSEEHDDGRYWSSMLTCVFEGMEPSLGTAQARNRILTLVLAHHEDLVPTEDNVAFADSLAALRAEDQARFGGQDVARISQCGLERLGIDSSPPVVTGALSPAAPDGANGWYRTSPTVAWSFSDAESTPVKTGCDPNSDTSDTPGRTLTCSVSSEGGTTTRTLSYRKDGTPPSVGITLSRSNPEVGQTVTATPNAADNLSGVAAASCGTVDTSSAGTKTVNCTATDQAGNSTTTPFAVTVRRAGSTPLSYRLSRVKLADSGTITFRLRLDRSVRVRVSAKSGKVKFRTHSKRFVKNKTIKVTLKLTKKQRAAWQKKLDTGKRQRVTVTLKPTGGKAVKLTLRVRRR